MLACIHINVSSVDGYCSTDQSDRVGDGPCHMIERETFQVILHSRYGNKTLSVTDLLGPDNRSILTFMSQNEYEHPTYENRESVAGMHLCYNFLFLQGVNDKRHFIRTSRPAVGLVERTPQPLDSWV